MSDNILRVAVPSPLPRLFDYLPPTGFQGTLYPGVRLRVPFGRTRQVAVLVELAAESEVPRNQLRPALEVLDHEPLLPAELLALLRWAARYYHHPPGEVMSAALPVLLRQGRSAQTRSAPVWRLSLAGREALQDAALERAPRQRTLLKRLADEPEGLRADALRDLPDWSGTARSLLKKGWLIRDEPSPMTTPTGTAPALSEAQHTAVSAVVAALEGFRSFLLDGVTGSGKTEVYLRIIQAVLARDRQALVLVPEIGLTPQLLARFQARLPGPLAVLHSALGDRERLNAWLLARSGQARVVIGTRSAIFTPLARPGVIIIDEEHDPSFKQQEGFRYSARDLALVRAQRLAIPVLLGSATPALESLHNARRGRYQWLRLPARVGGAREAPIELLDVRRQPMDQGISRPLAERMQKHLAHGGQVLLFLNRRGFAPTLICHECGWLAGCERCDARLTLHTQRRQRLICHHCGVEQAAPTRCPACAGVDLRALGQGTERIEQYLQQHFGEVGIARIDRDSTRRKGSLEALLADIHAGRRRVLLGTQMLAKGHHFPDVTLVGIVDADGGLFGTDFRASERMAQLILQVAGRAGRAERPGVVVVQTHHPQHPLLNTLVREGYGAFARATLAEREAALLPPFSNQALLRADATDPLRPLGFLEDALARGLAIGMAVELLGPVPAPMERRAGRYRAQLLVQANERALLHGFLDRWLAALPTCREARRVRWSLDVDPLDLL